MQDLSSLQYRIDSKTLESAQGRVRSFFNGCFLDNGKVRAKAERTVFSEGSRPDISRKRFVRYLICNTSNLPVPVPVPEDLESTAEKRSHPPLSGRAPRSLLLRSVPIKLGVILKELRKHYISRRDVK